MEYLNCEFWPIDNTIKFALSIAVKCLIQGNIRQYKTGILLYVITSKNGSREYYFLYEVVDGKLKKLGKAKSPADLCEKYKVYERIHE